MQSSWKKLFFKDGIPFSKKFNDFYFSKEDPTGLKESQHNFIRSSKLEQFLNDSNQEPLAIGELGFGTGINFINTLKTYKKTRRRQYSFVSCEKYPIPLKSLKSFYKKLPEEEQKISQEIISQYPFTPYGIHTLYFDKKKVKLILFFGDVRDFLPLIQKPCDFWFLDGFNPKKNPDIWDDDVLILLREKTKFSGTLHSFSVQGNLCRNLKRLGFLIEKKIGYGQKRNCLWAKYGQVSERKNYSFPWFHFHRQNKYKEKKAIIIGAGISGCSIANALGQRGWKIHLFEKENSCAKKNSALPFAIIKPKIFTDSLALINQLSSLAFPMAFNSITLLSKINPSIIYQRGIQECIEKCINEFPKGIIQKKGNRIYYPQALIVCPRELCHTLIKEGKGFIKTYYQKKITKIKKSKNDEWEVWDNKKAIDKAEVLIIASAWDSIKNMPFDLTHPQLSQNYGSAFELENNIDETVIKRGIYMIKKEQGSFWGSSFSLQKINNSKSFEQITDKFKNSEVDLSNLKIEKVFKGERIYTKDSFPLVGQSNFEQELKKLYGDLRKGKKPHWYPRSKKSQLFFCSAFGSKGMTYSFLASEVLASQINNEQLIIPKKILELLEPNRLYIRLLKNHSRL